MATTIKGRRGKKSGGAKARRKTEMKPRDRNQAKIGKPTSKPRTQKVKAAADEDASRRKSMKRTARLAPSGGGTVWFYPPLLDSAVGMPDGKTIRLTWFPAHNDSQFAFKRTNLSSQVETRFRVSFTPPLSHPFTHDDKFGVDPETSYRYIVAALYDVFPSGLGPWSDPVIGTTPNTPFLPTFEGTLRGDEEGWEGYCLVQRIESHGLKRSGGQVQLTLRASSTAQYGAFIESVYISKVAVGGNPYDSAEDLTEVTPKFDIQRGQTFTLPAISYRLDRTQPLLIAVDFKVPPWPSGISYRPVVRSIGPGGQPTVPVGIAYWNPGAQAAIKNRSAGYASANRIYLIERIGVR